MENLKMHTPDLAEENFKKLAALFPNAVTETKDENGNVVRAIDADVLRQEISASVVEGPQERYQFTWPDKKKSVVLANQPIAKTLRLDREKSVGKDGTPGNIDTENIYIEGDNLDTLKLLQETYLGKVKMIYIDPPYNTGNDFIYEDDFSQNTDNYLGNSGQFDEEGNRLVQNTESNGRFHTDWLNMIYPRLRLAKDLLTDDGVIFISIDDGELDNLRKACNDVFGASNFVADLCVVNNLKGRNDKKYIARANERLLMYVKSPNFVEHGLALDEEVVSDYREQDSKGLYRLLELRKRGGQDTRKDRPNMYYPFYVDIQTGEVALEPSDKFSQIAFPVKSNGEDGRWRWGKETAAKSLSELYGKKVGDKYNIYQKDYLESEDGARRVRPKSVLSGASYSTDVSTKEYRSIMGKIDFNNPKSTTLLSDLIIYATQPDEEALIMDFFSGSGTTAHAMFKANAEENGNRRFIMVQLPEQTDVKSEAHKSGYKTICDIGEERIRRTGKKIKEESPLTTTDLDVGFRVFKVDSTNMEDVYYRPADYNQGQMELFADNIKPDRSPKDLLFQVMLDLGILLSSDIQETEIAGKKVFSVADGYLIACFDKDVTEETVKAIAQKQPVYAVFRDSSMASDSVATNFEQIFETYSPRTQRKVL